MLSRPNRLTKEADIKKVLARGRSFFSPAFRLRVLVNHKPASRFAVVVSTRVSKKATERNRVRRQIRAIIKAALPEMATGFDVLISVNRVALELDFASLERQLRAVFKKAKIG